MRNLIRVLVKPNQDAALNTTGCGVQSIRNIDRRVIAPVIFEAVILVIRILEFTNNNIPCYSSCGCFDSPWILQCGKLTPIVTKTMINWLIIN